MSNVLFFDLVRILLLAAFLLSIGWAFAVRSSADRVLIYRHAPLETVSTTHRMQVAQVRALLSPGLPLIYIDPLDEPWQAGMWQRSFYPHNVVYRTRTAVDARRIRERFRAAGTVVQVAVVSGRFQEDAGFVRMIPLRPDDPAGAPLTVGIWSDGPQAR